MKNMLFLIPALLIGLFLTGCAKNNVNDDVAVRTRNANEPTRMNDQHRGGPAITGVDNGQNRNNIMDNRNDNRSRMRVADDAAHRVSRLPGVDFASVIVTDNNAYVAAKLDGGKSLNHDLEGRISSAVKSADGDIDQVYVSENPDFIKQMDDYTHDIRSGRPISGLFNEFSDMVRRVFPDRK